MNWKIILQLSNFGLLMAYATVYYIPSTIEPLFWLVIFIICAITIAKKCTGKYFLNGFMVSIFNCVWITAAHVLLYKTYIANHPEMLAMLEGDSPLKGHPRLMMAITGPVIGIISGLVLGLFSLIASKIFRKPN